MVYVWSLTLIRQKVGTFFSGLTILQYVVCVVVGLFLGCFALLFHTLKFRLSNGKFPLLYTFGFSNAKPKNIAAIACVYWVLQRFFCGVCGSGKIYVWFCL